MAFTTAGGKSITAVGSVATGATGAAGTAASTASSGVLKALGLSNPVGWALLGLDLGILLIRLFLFKPKLEPLPVKSINITGGREQARHLFGQNRVDLEWTDVTTLPGGQYRDNYKQFIACVTEGAAMDVLQMWIDEQLLPTQIDPLDSTHLIPSPGNQFTLPPGDVSKYNFPTKYAAELRFKFLGFGTPQQLEDQAASARTDGNIRWEAPLNRRYDGNPGAADWDTTLTPRTTRFFDPQPYCADGSEVQYDGDGNPFCFNQLTRQRANAEIDLLPNSPRNVIRPLALEVKRIDATYLLAYISWIQFNWFEPFYQQTNRNEKLYKAAPSVSVLMRGKLMTTPYRDPDTNAILHTDPVYSANPIAILHWIDREYRGLPESRIDQESYLAAYDHCEELLTYRYGAATPDDAVGANGEFYARSDGRIYERVEGAWIDLGASGGDYSWLAAQGENGVYTVPRYRCHLEMEVGAELEDVYRQVLACCGDGRRYEHRGKIHYRVAVPRNSTLTVHEEDILEVGEVQPWMPVKSRVNKLSARMRQSEENEWQPDDVEFADDAAIARDGETRQAQYALDGCTNPVLARNLLKIQLGNLRTPAVWPVRIGWFPAMEQRDIQPLDTITLSHEEYGWSSTEVQVIGLVHLPDRTAVCLCRRYEPSIYGATLALPGIPARPAIRFPTSSIPLDLTGLRATDRQDVRHDSIRNWTDVHWDPKVVDATEVEYQLIAERRFPLSGRVIVRGAEPALTLITRLYADSGRVVVRGTVPVARSANRYHADSGRVIVRGAEPAAASGRSIFDPTVGLSEERGIFFRQLNLQPLSIASSDGTNQYGIDQTNRWGDWLNYQGVPNSAALPFRQLAFERGADGIPDGDGIPILGTTTEAAEELQFRRFGVYADNARSDLRGMTLLQLVGLGETGGIPSNDFSDDQKANWRFVMRDSNHNTFVMHLPAASEDPSNPYLWRDDETVPFRQFIRNARAAGATIDFAIVDSTSRWIDMAALYVTYSEHRSESGRVIVRGPASLPAATRTKTYLNIWTDSRTPAPSRSVGLLYRISGLIFPQINVGTHSAPVYAGQFQVWGGSAFNPVRRFTGPVGSRVLTDGGPLLGFSRAGSAQTVYFEDLHGGGAPDLQRRASQFQFKLRDAIGQTQTVYARTDPNALTLDIDALTFIFQSEIDGETLVFGQADINSSCNQGFRGGRQWTGPRADDTEWRGCWSLTNVEEAMRAFVTKHSVRRSDQSSATNRFRLAVVDAANARIRARDGTISDF